MMDMQSMQRHHKEERLCEVLDAIMKFRTFSVLFPFSFRQFLIHICSHCTIVWRGRSHFSCSGSVHIQTHIACEGDLHSHTRIIYMDLTEHNCSILQNFENFLKRKSLISQSFYRQLIKVRGVLKLSGSKLSKAPLTFSQKCILRG